MRKCTKYVWRPSSARTRLESSCAPTDRLAAMGGATSRSAVGTEFLSPYQPNTHGDPRGDLHTHGRPGSSPPPIAARRSVGAHELSKRVGAKLGRQTYLVHLRINRHPFDCSVTNSFLSSLSIKRTFPWCICNSFLPRPPPPPKKRRLD